MPKILYLLTKALLLKSFLYMGLILITPLTFAETTPIELGHVQWHRQLDQASVLAKTENKPIFILFQEVPGCFTCQNYGHTVLSHPLIVEAIESLFIPVVIFNNHGGDDAKTLRQYNEPAWNNPVIRIVDASQDNILPRLAGDYSKVGLIEYMITALKKTQTLVPNYLLLLHKELSNKQAESAIFAMPCFWSGEGFFGQLPGVIATRPGFLSGFEVVAIKFDPTVLSYKNLVQQANKSDMTHRVFTRSDQQQRQAQEIVGKLAIRNDQDIRPDRQPKYYLSQTLLKYLPMTQIQASRINSAVGQRRAINDYLSPRQRKVFQMIQNQPHAGWINVVDHKSFPQAWHDTIKKQQGSIQ